MQEQPGTWGHYNQRGKWRKFGKRGVMKKTHLRQMSPLIKRGRNPNSGDSEIAIIRPTWSFVEILLGENIFFPHHTTSFSCELRSRSSYQSMMGMEPSAQMSVFATALTGRSLQALGPYHTVARVLPKQNLHPPFPQLTATASPVAAAFSSWPPYPVLCLF